MILTRQTVISVLSAVTVALITSTIRELPMEVPVGGAHGLDHECVINCDNIAPCRRGRSTSTVATSARYSGFVAR